MEPLEVLRSIRSAVKRFLGDGKFPEISEIKEPTINDVFGICCGPRLFTKALKLHGEDLSVKSSEDRSEGKDNRRP